MANALTEELVRRLAAGDWAVRGVANSDGIPVQVLAWFYEAFGVDPYHLVLAVIVDKGEANGTTETSTSDPDARPRA